MTSQKTAMFIVDVVKTADSTKIHVVGKLKGMEPPDRLKSVCNE